MTDTINVHSASITELLRPSWWADAACRDDDVNEWMIEKSGSGSGGMMQRKALLSARCAACPVHFQCMLAGLQEPPNQRVLGPFRASLSGQGWTKLRALVADLGLDPFNPDDEEDLAVLSAWVADSIVTITVKSEGRSIEMREDWVENGGEEPRDVRHRRKTVENYHEEQRREAAWARFTASRIEEIVDAEDAA